MTTVDECNEREKNPMKEAARMGLRLAEERMEEAEANLAAARNRWRQVDCLPKQPKPGSVIKFQVQANADAPVWTYIATRAAGASHGYWLIAGDHRTHTWSAIVEKMMEDEMNKRTGTVSFYDFEKQKWQGRKP